MFGFRKKEVDKEKVRQFCDWFLENEQRIRKSVENQMKDTDTMMKVLDEVEAELAKVYRTGYRGNIEFDYGGKDDDYSLNLYHKNNKFLIQATNMISQEMNSRENPIWKVTTDR